MSTKIDPEKLLAQLKEVVHIPTDQGGPDGKFDPLFALARLGTNPHLEDKERIACLKEVAQYVYAKRKPVDDKGDSDDKVLYRLEVLTEDEDAAEGN